MPKPPDGRIPRSSDPTKAMIVIKESWSLFLFEHLNSRLVGGYCCSFYKSCSNLPKCPWCQIKLPADWNVADMTSKRKEHCNYFPASIFHPWVGSYVCHSWSLSRHPIHSEEQKWQGESRVIIFFLFKKKKKSTFGQERNFQGEPEPSAPFWAHSLCHFLSVVRMLASEEGWQL